MFAMSRKYVGLIAVVTLAACGGGGGGSDGGYTTSPGGGTPPPPVTPGANEVIATTSNVFTPGTLTVSKGTSVTFTFQNTAHNVNFANVAGAPANIATTSNGAVQRVFATSGSFGYDCSLHSGMTGTIIVN
ncbi:MAG: cupredoxin domain-containing protein [Gemmatimonadetes bacterium]|nr:cupredoxin domain-containing protein [Gemmatimonadota bacterium]